MKIRNGFVSNSSSSSFVVLGQKYSTEEIEQLLKDYDVDSSQYDAENLMDAFYDEAFDDQLPENFTIAVHGEEQEMFIGIYRSGEYDFSTDVCPDDFNKFKGNKKIKLYGGEYCC